MIEEILNYKLDVIGSQIYNNNLKYRSHIRKRAMIIQSPAEKVIEEDFPVDVQVTRNSFAFVEGLTGDGDTIVINIKLSGEKTGRDHIVMYSHAAYDLGIGPITDISRAGQGLFSTFYPLLRVRDGEDEQYKIKIGNKDLLLDGILISMVFTGYDQNEHVEGNIKISIRQDT